MSGWARRMTDNDRLVDKIAANLDARMAILLASRDDLTQTQVALERGRSQLDRQVDMHVRAVREDAARLAARQAAIRSHTACANELWAELCVRRSVVEHQSAALERKAAEIAKAKESLRCGSCTYGANRMMDIDEERRILDAEKLAFQREKDALSKEKADFELEKAALSKEKAASPQERAAISDQDMLRRPTGWCRAPCYNPVWQSKEEAALGFAIYDENFHDAELCKFAPGPCMEKGPYAESYQIPSCRRAPGGMHELLNDFR